MIRANARITIYIAIGLVAVAILGVMILSSDNSTPDGSGSIHVGPVAAVGESVAELLNLGQRFLLDLDYEQAIVMFTRVIEIEPRNVQALIGRGTALIMWQEDLAAARADFELALEIDEHSADAWLGMVEIYIRLSDFDRALEMARRGYELTGDEQLRERVEELEGGGGTGWDGRVRRISQFDADGVLLHWEVWRYEQGRSVGATTFDADGTILSTRVFLHDVQGNLVQDRTYDAAGNLHSRDDIHRDAYGRIIRRENYNHQFGDDEGVLMS